MLNTKPLLLDSDFPLISRGGVKILQLNLGYLCNLTCTHCHVNAGPKRTELMSRSTMDEILSYCDQHSIQCLDLTGGAPEMNPDFEYLVAAAFKRGISVIDRCNLTILLEPQYGHLVEFLANHRVTIIASLPCYSEKNVSEQRGKGVFRDSIQALTKLNTVGYGRDPNLNLSLVYNPNGAFLPPNQQSLEKDYKKKLSQDYDIVFNQLLTITNMPISRFGSMLLSKGLYEDYMQLLKDNFSDDNLKQLMCRHTLSIDWQGYVYDCDFNQMLDLPLLNFRDLIATDKKKYHIKELINLDLNQHPIAVGEHCYGCTAGQGSSCGGALSS